MTQSLQAVYENGVLRPLSPLTLHEHQRVTVTVSDESADGCLDEDFLSHLQAQADETATLEQVRAALAKIPGSMVDDFRRERDERV